MSHASAGWPIGRHRHIELNNVGAWSSPDRSAKRCDALLEITMHGRSAFWSLRITVTRVDATRRYLIPLPRQVEASQNSEF